MLAALLLCVSVSLAQQEMSKDEWQQEVNRYTQLRNELQAKLQQLNNDITALQSLSSKMDGDVTKCMDELYALVGSDAQKAAAYRAEIEAAERKADELMRLSDADLMARSAEVKELEAKASGFRNDKLSLVPEFSERLDALDQKVASLVRSISATAEKSYTVKGGDCLWNISKKKDIYSNAWLWPKIWQANDTKIKNPDLIYPRQTFTVPPGSELTAEERAAANRYYRQKQGAM
jgi:predicted RNase H-like nuclease (RuvC/YqgF family)